MVCAVHLCGTLSLRAAQLFNLNPNVAAMVPREPLREGRQRAVREPLERAVREPPESRQRAVREPAVRDRGGDGIDSLLCVQTNGRRC